MYRTPGLNLPTHRSMPAVPAEPDTLPVNSSRQVPGVTEPFMFTRLFLVTGILLAVLALAAVVSG